MSERAGNAGGQEETDDFLLTSLAQYLPAGGLCATLQLRLCLFSLCLAGASSDLSGRGMVGKGQHEAGRSL